MPESNFSDPDCAKASHDGRRMHTKAAKWGLIDPTVLSKLLFVNMKCGLGTLSGLVTGLGVFSLKLWEVSGGGHSHCSSAIEYGDDSCVRDIV